MAPSSSASARSRNQTPTPSKKASAAGRKKGSSAESSAKPLAQPGAALDPVIEKGLPPVPDTQFLVLVVAVAGTAFAINALLVFGPGWPQGFLSSISVGPCFRSALALPSRLLGSIFSVPGAPLRLSGLTSHADFLSGFGLPQGLLSLILAVPGKLQAALPDLIVAFAFFPVLIPLVAFVLVCTFSDRSGLKLWQKVLLVLLVGSTLAILLMEGPARDFALSLPDRIVDALGYIKVR